MEHSISKALKASKIQVVNIKGNAKYSLGSSEAAGIDLHCLDGFTLEAGERKPIKTGLKIKIPKGFFGKIMPRSKLAKVYGLDVLAGVVDSDYTGEITVMLINHGMDDIEFEAKSKIAQLVVMPHYSYTKSIINVDSLPETDRGDKGINCSNMRSM